MGNRPVRTLALVIVTFNITWAAPMSVLVLWALQRVGIGEAGFGLLTTATALGGLVGTFSYGWLERRVPLARLMRLALGCEVVYHLGDGAEHVAVDGVPADVLLRRLRVRVGNAVQRRAPARGADRVPGPGRSVYMICVMGGMLIGSLLGGVIAHYGGIVAPWWFAFIGSGLTLALVWRQLDHIAHADEEAIAAT